MQNRIIQNPPAIPNYENIESALWTQTPDIKDRNKLISLLASVKAALSDSDAINIITRWAEGNYPPAHANKILTMSKSVKDIQMTTAGALFKAAFADGWTPEYNPTERSLGDYHPSLKNHARNEKEEKVLKRLVALRPFISNIRKITKSEHNYLREKNIPQFTGACINPPDLYKNCQDSTLFYHPAFSYKDEYRLKMILSIGLYDLKREQGKPKWEQQGWELIPHKLINEDKFPKFQLSNKFVQGGWSKIGIIGTNYPKDHNKQTIVIAEGFSTAATIAMYYPKYCCFFSCGKDNLVRATSDLKKCYRRATIIIAADNDIDDGGLQCAIKAARTNSCRVTMPKRVGHDYNDLHTSLMKLDDKQRKRQFKKQFNTLQPLTPTNLNKPNQDSLSDFKTAYNVVKKGNGVTLIDSRYMGASVADLAKDHKVMAIVSPMGSGKTDSIKYFVKQIDNVKPVVIYISPRVRLNYAIQEEDDLLITVYKRGLQGEELLNTAVTPITLPELIDKLMEFLSNVDEEYHDQYDDQRQEKPIYVIMDEVNAINSLMTSKVNKNKLNSFRVLSELCREAKNVLCMDAFLNAQTEKFINAIMTMHLRSETLYTNSRGGAELSNKANNTEQLNYERLLSEPAKPNEFHKLENINKPWNTYTASIVTSDQEGVKDDDIKGVMVAELLQDIESGKKIYIACGSSTWAYKLYSLIGKLYENVNRVYLASQKAENLTETDKKLAMALIREPKEVMDKFDVIMGAPAVSVGISLNKKDTYHKVYAFGSNHENTGDSESFVQMMARLRDVKSKEWRIFLESDKTVFTNVMPRKALAVLELEGIQNLYNNWDVANIVAPIANISATNRFMYETDKNNYKKNVISLLESMGMRVIYDNVDINPLPNRVTNAIQDVEKEVQEAERQLILSSERIPQSIAKKIATKVKYNFHAATREEYGKHLRYQLEDQYQCNLDTMSEKATEEVLTMWNDNVFYKLNRREQAELYLNDTTFCTRLERALRNGVGQSEAFKRDWTSDKQHIRKIMKLDSYTVKLYQEGGKFEPNDWKWSKRLRDWLNKPQIKYGGKNLTNAQDLHRLEVIRITPAQIKKPHILQGRLADPLAYKVKKTRVRDGSKLSYDYQLVQDEAVERLAYVRKENGTTYPEIITSLLDQYEAGKKPDQIVSKCNAQDPVQETDEYTETEDLRENVRRRLLAKQSLEELIESDPFNRDYDDLKEEEDREEEWETGNK